VILFAAVSLNIPESDLLGKSIISIIATAIFFAFINLVLFNINSLKQINQKMLNRLENSNICIINSEDVALFNNSSENKSRNFFSLLFATVLGLIIFFLSTSHYLFYIVDNSGSMGTCPNWNGQNCGELGRNPDESTVKIVTDYLGSIFKDKILGSEEVPKASSDVKVGLIEIGGKTYIRGQCIANVLTEPELNNKEQLLQDLTKIKANDDGITALIKSLKKAEDSIRLKTSNYLKYAASKNVILFTDGYEDNCEAKKPKTFCEAVNELPDDFNVTLSVYYLSESKDECGQFQCGKKYSANSCKVISNQKIKEGSLPKLGLILALPPVLANISYITLISILVCATTITWLILKCGEEKSYYFYPKKIGSFVFSSVAIIKDIGKYIINFLGKEEKIPRFSLLIILILIVILYIFR